MLRAPIPETSSIQLVDPSMESIEKSRALLGIEVEKVVDRRRLLSAGLIPYSTEFDGQDVGIADITSGLAQSLQAFTNPFDVPGGQGFIENIESRFDAPTIDTDLVNRFDVAVGFAGKEILSVVAQSREPAGGNEFRAPADFRLRSQGG